jgi:dTDP-4-dehydrorhamnose 3,5-epimerase
MNCIPTELEGLYIIEPTVFGDERGYFMETFSQRVFSKMGIDVNFVQDNESMSNKGVLRGLHYQAPPKAQGKLVSVVQGAVFDVAVDIRPKSATYGQHFAAEINARNKRRLYIPPGFAHGFLTLENNTIFQYKCTELYAPEHEGGIAWNDPKLAIEWPEINDLIISEKDQNNPLFSQFHSPF